MIDSETKVVGIIGNPVRHSLSPIMHNKAFSHLGLNWVYLSFEVEPGRVRSAIEGARDLGMVGLNVTMPFKMEAVEWVDIKDGSVILTGSLNTLLFKDGKIMGFNTDGIGFLNSLREKGIPLQGRKVLLIGAGGAARAVAFVVAQQGVARLTVLNRTPQKAHRLAQELRSFKPETEVSTASYDLDLALVISDSDLIINATSVGMKDHPGIPIPTDDIDQRHVVYDLVYWPLRTELLKRSEERGARVVSGLEMLIHQGAESFRIWTGKEFPIPIVREELTEYLKSIEDNSK